jgi:hypothetical protein
MGVKCVYSAHSILARANNFVSNKMSNSLKVTSSKRLKLSNEAEDLQSLSKDVIIQFQTYLNLYPMFLIFFTGIDRKNPSIRSTCRAAEKFVEEYTAKTRRRQSLQAF